MARRQQTYTRMEKIEQQITAVGLAAGASLEQQWQIEGGDEEVQVKRITFSAGLAGLTFASTLPYRLRVWLADEAMTGVQPDDRLVVSLNGAGSLLLDRVTTMRVRRGDHMMMRLDNLSTNEAADGGATALLHYKVLS